MVQTCNHGSTAIRPVVDITAAIATFNRPQALARCLDALLAGEVLPAEIVVVDQGDDEQARTVADGRGGCGVHLRYIRQAARGLSASRNAAIAHSGRSIIAVTDDDCIPDRRWIAVIAGSFATVPAPAAVTGRVLPFGPDVAGLYAVSSRTMTVRAEFTGAVEPWRVGTGANFAATREWLARVGPYDERLGTGSPAGAGEDMDMLYRLTRAGARVLYEPDAVVYHERQTGASRMASRSRYGRGMGTFCALWLRRRDRYAARMLGRWLAGRTYALGAAARRGQWRSAYEEFLMLRGTAAGLLRGLRDR